MKSIIAASLAASLLLLTGCATLVGSSTASVAISSVPPGAAVNIVDETGFAVYKGATPTTVILEKSNGGYWGGKRFKVTLSLAGYQDQTVLLNTHANGWYLAGNFMLGGVIGWFLVDPLNGGMYTLSPDKVDTTLTAQNATT